MFPDNSFTVIPLNWATCNSRDSHLFLDGFPSEHGGTFLHPNSAVFSPVGSSAQCLCYTEFYPSISIKTCSNSCWFKMIHNKAACCLVSCEAVTPSLGLEAWRCMCCLFFCAREILVGKGYPCCEVCGPVPRRGISRAFGGCRRPSHSQPPTFTSCITFTFPHPGVGSSWKQHVMAPSPCPPHSSSWSELVIFFLPPLYYKE